MNENFLHFVWKHKYLNNTVLKTIEGDTIEIVKIGFSNPNAGPDFLEVQLRIKNILWVGSIEIDMSTTNWLVHKHHKNPQYQNVILHVVYKHNTDHILHDLPILELEKYIDKQLIEKYKDFQNFDDQLPCFKQINKIEPIKINNWLERLATERLERKSNLLIERLNILKGNWEQLVYEQLMQNFGFKVNSDAFVKLSESLPFKYLENERLQPFAAESFLLGQAGFLSIVADNKYVKILQKEYLFYKEKYQLQPIDKALWKFLKMRPLNFPTIRLVQIASLFTKKDSLFETILKVEKIEQIYAYFDIELNLFWDTHFTLEKESPLKQSKKIGKTTIDVIIINTFVPILYTYGVFLKSDNYKEKAIVLIEKIQREKNTVVSKWIDQKVVIKNALDSQGILELNQFYCIKKRCLDCSIGFNILKA